MLTEKTKLARTCLLGSSLTVALLTTGCRSGMPGAGMFGMRSQPSPEAIAAAGPSTNYPTPPSASAKPEAIASIAGGTVPISNGVPETATAQAAGFNVSPGFATPAGATDSLPAGFDPNSITRANPGGSTSPNGLARSAGTTNPAAAQANGFGGGPDSAYPLPGSQPSGYAFGSKSFTPKPEPAAMPSDVEPPSDTPFAPPASTPGPSSYALSDAQKPGGLTVPSLDSIGIDPSIAASGAGQPTATPKAGGFTLPASMSGPNSLGGAVAATTTPEPPADIVVPDAPPGGFEPPAADSPSFSTASLGGPLAAPSSSTAPGSSFGAPASPASTAPSGYAPGSIGSSQGYPTATGASPSTNGTIFRY